MKEFLHLAMEILLQIHFEPIFYLKPCIFFADMFELEMVISWLEIQRNVYVSLQVRKFDGVCVLPDCDWLERENIVSFSLDLANATRMMGSVRTSMIPLK